MHIYWLGQVNAPPRRQARNSWHVICRNVRLSQSEHCFDLARTGKGNKSAEKMAAMFDCTAFERVDTGCRHKSGEKMAAWFDCTAFERVYTGCRSVLLHWNATSTPRCTATARDVDVERPTFRELRWRHGVHWKKNNKPNEVRYHLGWTRLCWQANQPKRWKEVSVFAGCCCCCC